MEVYLDSNIHGYLEAKSITINSIVSNCHLINEQFPYSYIHLFEAININDSKRIMNRCDTLNEISGRRRIIYDVVTKQHLLIPADAIKSLQEIGIRALGIISVAFENFKTLLPQQEELQELLDFKAVEMNNLSAIELLKSIDDKLSATSFSEIVTAGIASHSSLFVGIDIEQMTRYMVYLYFLDLFKYFPDRNQKNQRSRIWDGAHVFHASACDYFITADRNTAYKANILFQWFKVDTETILWRDGKFEFFK